MADSSLKYYALLAQGDKDLQLQNYEAAAVSFNTAHALRPEDIFPVQRLAEIKNKLADKEKTVQAENDKKFVITTAEAKYYYDQKKYAEAEEAYKRALALKPGDVNTTRQLKTIDGLLAKINTQNEPQKIKDRSKPDSTASEKALAIKQLTDQNNYYSAVKKADDLFKAGYYNSAKIEYNKALTFIDKDWPKEQIIKIGKIINDQVAQANAEKQKLVQQQNPVQQPTLVSQPILKNDSIVKANEIKKKYVTALAQGKSSYSKNDFLNAKAFYEEAMKLNPSEEEPKKQLKIINDKLEEIAAEGEKKKYAAALARGKSSYSKNDFLNAKIFYEEAMKLNPSEEEPKKQFKIINDKLEEIAAETEIKKKYTAALAQGKSSYIKNDFLNAKTFYEEAMNLSPSEEEPKKQLKIINDKLEEIAAEGEKKKYASALAQGKSSYIKNDFLNAKIFYQEAINLNPSQEEPKKQLAIINNKLEEIAREAEIEKSYERTIDLADSQVNAKAFDSAIITYKAATTIKPLELYPKKQLRYIQSELKLIEKGKLEERERRYIATLTRADKAVTDKNYVEAASAYTEALGVHPDNEYAKRRLEIISYQLEIEKQKAEKLSRDTIIVVPEKKPKRKRS